MKEEFDILFAEHQKLLGELRAMRALAQPEQEPVGEVILYIGDGFPCAPFHQVKWRDGMMPPEGTKLYTMPPQRKPLTVQEIAEFVGTHEYGPEQLKWFRFGEAAHGIKE